MVMGIKTNIRLLSRTITLVDAKQKKAASSSEFKVVDFVQDHKQGQTQKQNITVNYAHARTGSTLTVMKLFVSKPRTGVVT